MALVNQKDQPGLTVEAFGVRLAVQVDDPGLLDGIRARLAMQSTPGVAADSDAQLALASSDGFHYELRYDDLSVAHSVELDVAMAMLEAGVHAEVAQRARGAAFIRGGAVGVADRALVLPGGRFAGTSTLIRELIRQGATPISDGYAVLDGGGSIRHFAEPSSVSSESTRWPIGLIAATVFIPGAVWAPQELGPADAALMLLSHSVTLRDDPARTMEIVRPAVAGISALEAHRGEAADTAGALLDRMTPR